MTAYAGDQPETKDRVVGALQRMPAEGDIRADFLERLILSRNVGQFLARIWGTAPKLE